MQTFIRASEIWVPSRDRSMLEFHRGMYGDLARFRHASERMCFGYDEGLPGKAWAARHPIILKDLQNSYFMRAQAAKDAGLTCGVAIPVFAGDYLLAVVVLYCGADADHVVVCAARANADEQPRGDRAPGDADLARAGEPTSVGHLSRCPQFGAEELA